LDESATSYAPVAGVLELFLAEGILSISSLSSARDVICELSDPAFVKSWSRIADWIRQDLPLRRWRREFRSAADAWRSSRNDALLLAGEGSTTLRDRKRRTESAGNAYSSWGYLAEERKTDGVN
jgi:hypothetical protein